MKPAPIQLTDYFVTDLHLSANPKFDPKLEIPVQFKDFQVGLEANSTPEKNRDWQLSLKLQFQPPADANVPYRFSADIVGFFFVHPDVPADRIEILVKTNGSSMLFGALREIIRDASARGPFPALILPATSFYESAEKKPDVAGKSSPHSKDQPPQP